MPATTDPLDSLPVFSLPFPLSSLLNSQPTSTTANDTYTGVSAKMGIVNDYSGGGSFGSASDNSRVLEGESWRGGFTGGSPIGVSYLTKEHVRVQ